MRRALVIAAVYSLVALATLGQTVGKRHNPAVRGDEQAAVEKWIDEYAVAARRGDVSFFDKHLARDYIGIGPDGHISTKPEVIALYTSGEARFERVEVNDRRASLYGSTALVFSEMTLQGHSGTTELNGTYRSTRVLIKRKDGQWQSVSFQLTKVQ